MNQGRIIVITGAPGTGKTTTASAVAKESDLEKSVHMHTDDFYHYLSKGAIPPHLPESNEQNLIVIEAFLEAAKRYAAYPLSRFAPYSSYKYAPTDRRLLHRRRSVRTYTCGYRRIAWAVYEL